MSLKPGRARSSTGSSSSILKKSTSLKRRLTEIVKSPAKVRFHLPQKNVRKVLEHFIKTGETKEYFSLVCMIRDAEFLDSDLLLLLREANDCILLLNQDLRLFVEAMLNISWNGRSSDVVKEYQGFVVNLLSAHTYHSRYVISQLVSLFLPDPKDPEWPDGKPTDSDKQKCLNIHVAIKIILDVIPMCQDILLQAINKQYPYYSKPLHVQEYYLHNILTILSYQPSLKPDILHLIFVKLVVMDVNAPKEVILKQREEDEIFQMELETKSVRTVNTTFTEVNRSNLAVTLDICIDLLLDYLIGECKNAEGELDWDQTKDVYQSVLPVFDKVILPTYASHHIQFVMFALCALKPALTEAFLNFLWKKVCNPNVPIVLRQSAVTYIASLVARGLFVPLSVVKATMQQMAEWIHAYIANQDAVECVIAEIRAHAVFYSVCQALFYLVAFRHKDLVERKKNIIFLESLQLGKMITSQLNPLRVCQDAVVQNFAAVTRKYQLAYCYTVIDHNKRNSMPTIYQDDTGSRTVSGQCLSDFYPFDPYVLEVSGRKIQPHYRDYQEDAVDSAMETVETRENDVDDFLENVTETKGSHQFSYGSSPGFKFKF